MGPTGKIRIYSSKYRWLINNVVIDTILVISEKKRIQSKSILLKKPIRIQMDSCQQLIQMK